MKQPLKLIFNCLFVTTMILATSCESSPKKEQKKSTSLPSFVRDARELAKEISPPDMTPLQADLLVPERAEGDNILKLPTREKKNFEEAPRFDFAGELIKGGKIEDLEEKQEVKLEFDALPLTDVIPAFAAMLGDFSYLVDPAVKGAVTFNVNAQMSAREIWSMFEHILWLSGAYVSRNDQFFEILPFEKMPEERRLFVKHNPANVEVAMLHLDNTLTSEIAANIKPFMTKGANLTEIKRLNSLLIVESPSNMHKIRALISELDRQWQKDWPQITVKCHKVDTAVIVEELKSIMPIIGLPVVFDAPKSDGIEIKVAQVARLQVLIVSGPTLDGLQEVEKWIKVLDREDIGEQENIFYYNVRHSTLTDLRSALDTFFITEGPSSSGNKSSSTSKKAATTTNTSNNRTNQPANTARTTPTTNKNNNNQERSSNRNSAYDTPVIVHEDVSQNRFVLRTTPRTFALIKATLTRLDIPPLQVLIQATIVDLTLTNQLKYGLRYAMERSVAGGKTNANIGFGSNGKPGGLNGDVSFGAGDSSIPGSGLNILFKDGKSALDLIATIAGKENSSVVSAPQVVALSDHEAVIDVSQSKSIPSSTNINNGDYNTNYEYKNAGVVLTVTPHITANKEVTLELKQDVDEFLNDEKEIKNSDGDVTSVRPPSIIKRSIQTKLVVPDGATVLMGGLIRSKKNELVEGYPILMNIPWIGELFRYTEKNIERTELVVLITVNVIDNSTSLERLIKRYGKATETMRGVFEGTEFDDFGILNDIKDNHERLIRLRERREKIKAETNELESEYETKESLNQPPIETSEKSNEFDNAISAAKSEPKVKAEEKK